MKSDQLQATHADREAWRIFWPVMLWIGQRMQIDSSIGGTPEMADLKTTEGTHIRFVATGIPSGQKTMRWNVEAKESGVLIGEVKWFGPWRKFCFFPASDSVFEGTCMRDISQFIEERTRAHRKTT